MSSTSEKRTVGRDEASDDVAVRSVSSPPLAVAPVTPSARFELLTSSWCMLAFAGAALAARSSACARGLGGGGGGICSLRGRAKLAERAPITGCLRIEPAALPG